MKTSVIGFPRVGTLRELKFASEKYFRHEITAQELTGIAADLRHRHWMTQVAAGIGFIPCNDFSFYDIVLDTAVLLGIVPKRYRELNVSKLDTYFAMARGYQGESGDVKALAMKKWFNTNYHYIVPEIEDDTVISLDCEKLTGEYEEAKELGIKTKPMVIGPYTMLKLCRYVGSKNAEDFADDVAEAYRQLIAECDEENVEWLQFDEPSLVRDMDDDDKALFHRVYDRVFADRADCKILLQTYFGDVRDVYEDIINMPFAGIGLDFIEGKQTGQLIDRYGFPGDKVLFAGLVNSKNIWRNHYDKTLKVVGQLRDKKIDVVLSTSCSLLHVPYTLKQETKLSQDYLRFFAFAEEKLIELSELAALAESYNYTELEAYRKNQELFAGTRDCNSDAVGQRLAAVTEADYARLPKRSERQALQKKEFGLPELPTTTIGSFPQTKDVKSQRAQLRKGEISEQEYVDFVKGKIKECVKWQEDIGLDVLVHGEYERNDMVEYFGEALGGFLFTEKAWVQSYGTRCVKPPVIWGDVYRKKPITVDWSVYAQSLTDKIMKGMLTGPVTILNWSFPREDISIKESISQIALAIRDEVLDLEAHGIKMIQIDEAALREKLPLRKSDWYTEYLDFAIPAFRLTHSGVKAETQIHTHMCYSEFTDIIPAIDDMDADVITFEASRSDLQILDSLRENNFETEVGPGVYDIHSPRVPSVAEIVKAVNVMLTKIGRDKLWINPDCGLKTRGVPETDASLRNMVEAARQVRK
ncbi:5-methyltetrahydropteroyltriglutamate--homocysteine S-methyltransferase [Coprococcus sp. AF38-1]|uniref:5-methyltetrahydropteroyltriglutamate-- homocysteine S-methyltransferase n=1 Tax=Coprococcus sp. AF38-1 TaxID=2302943 RepID=UPI000E728801|nr:5-methyltetrahydropteroyltriglutamate--homocysteine S-methyltransferase [Coprococcus sp. AF38-1]RJW74825.1 5-methyltetrahydropteroyltriglutamate--homocysteine S-methyltransferase [Coprococcus sp. AF38-1]